MIGALYVDPKGPYPGLGLDCFDKDRDARTYTGPGPVIAHPPCGPWGKLRYFCTKQDPDLAPHAVEMVRRFGGVLEHPEGSLLWERCSLPHPFHSPPLLVGREWALRVDQVRWGHRALKRSWLFFVGVDPRALPPVPPPRAPTHVLDDKSWNPAASRGLKHLSKKYRHLTPPDFARWLVAAVEST